MTRNYYDRILGEANAGGLRQLGRSPAHYRQWVEDGGSDSPALAFGRAFHCLVLEPGRFALEFAIEPERWDRRTRAGKDDAAAFETANRDRTIVRHDDGQRLRAMADAVRRHPAAAPLLAAPGVIEPEWYWTDTATGIACKAKPDKWIPSDRTLVDLKSTLSAEPAQFTRTSLAAYGYHDQAAHYLSGARAVTGIAPRRFVFVAVEKAPPWAVMLGELRAGIGASALLEAAALTRDARMARLAACVESGEWPGYGDEVIDLDQYAPRWAVGSVLMDDDDDWTVTATEA